MRAFPSLLLQRALVARQLTGPVPFVDWRLNPLPLFVLRNHLVHSNARCPCCLLWLSVSADWGASLQATVSAFHRTSSRMKRRHNHLAHALFHIFHDQRPLSAPRACMPLRSFSILCAGLAARLWPVPLRHGAQCQCTPPSSLPRSARLSLVAICSSLHRPCGRSLRRLSVVVPTSALLALKLIPKPCGGTTPKLSISVLANFALQSSSNSEAVRGIQPSTFPVGSVHNPFPRFGACWHRSVPHASLHFFLERAFARCLCAGGCHPLSVSCSPSARSTSSSSLFALASSPSPFVIPLTVARKCVR
ncbi:hypothetical protein TRVL_05089 [Trypanosoma vivax]|nr:hypothetical protein TRVL_05089 [Trypanosoma vivax]